VDKGHRLAREHRGKKKLPNGSFNYLLTQKNDFARKCSNKKAEPLLALPFI